MSDNKEKLYSTEKKLNELMPSFTLASNKFKSINSDMSDIEMDLLNLKGKRENLVIESERLNVERDRFKHEVIELNGVQNLLPELRKVEKRSNVKIVSDKLDGFLLENNKSVLGGFLGKDHLNLTEKRKDRLLGIIDKMYEGKNEKVFTAIGSIDGEMVKKNQKLNGLKQELFPVKEAYGQKKELKELLEKNMGDLKGLAQNDYENVKAKIENVEFGRLWEDLIEKGFASKDISKDEKLKYVEGKTKELEKEYEYELLGDNYSSMRHIKGKIDKLKVYKNELVFDTGHKNGFVETENIKNPNNGESYKGNKDRVLDKYPNAIVEKLPQGNYFAVYSDDHPVKRERLSLSPFEGKTASSIDQAWKEASENVMKKGLGENFGISY